MVAVAIAVAIVITSIAPLYGAWRGLTTGQEFTGVQSLSPGDFAVYLSYIDQVKRGVVLLENTFTTEPLLPVFNILWFKVGLLARFFGLSALAAYHVARIFFVIPFGIISYLLLARFFDRVRERLVALFLFLFSSGLGVFFSSLFSGENSGAGTYERPIDLWVGESNTFLTMMYSPHFVASLTLILLVILLFLEAFESGRQRYAVAAGFAGLVLFQFHPFHAPTLFGVFAAFLGYEAVTRRVIKSHLISFFIFAAISVPAIFYHYILTHYDTGAKALLTANLTITPAPWQVIIGFGAPFLLAFFGFWLAGKKNGETTLQYKEFLTVWAIVQLALVYSPLTFQRRLLEGLEFPLVVLAVPAMMMMARRLKDLGTGIPGAVAQSVAAVFAVTVLFLGSFNAVATNVVLYRTNQPPLFYRSPAMAGALSWIRENTPQQAVFLASFDDGNTIGGWADRRVYAGHWVNTIAAVAKTSETAAFFGDWDDETRFRFAKLQGITHVFYGPKEREFGGTFLPSPHFVREFKNAEVEIFAVR